HSRRTVFSYLQNKEAAKELFDVIAPKVGNRPGGYTRIVRLGQRLGDAAEMAIIELVDFNETYKPNATVAAEPKKKTRRSTAAKKKADDATVVEEQITEATPTEEKTEE
ncbi:MAG TPA: 50S ribosomal protein L17, partial [Chitinophagales bacterium]|nr:50S ribosomal protein L17 [Chitinophagales bacterium]